MFIPKGANSMARALVSPRTAVLEVTYALIFASAVKEKFEARFIIFPFFASPCV